MACDCVTNALREHPDCYDHTNECVADRVEAAEAKGYAKALEDVQRRLLELAPLSRGADGEVCLKLAVKEAAALKEKGRGR